MDIHPMVVDFTLSVLAPILISFLKNVNWTPNQKLLLTFAVSVVLAFLSVWLSGEQLSVDNLVYSFSIVFTSATAIYRFLLERTELNTLLERTKVL